MSRLFQVLRLNVMELTKANATTPKPTTPDDNPNNPAMEIAYGFIAFAALLLFLLCYCTARGKCGPRVEPDEHSKKKYYTFDDDVNPKHPRLQ